MEQITLKKSNSRTVVSVAAAVDGLSISSEVTMKDGILTISLPKVEQEIEKSPYHIQIG